MACNDNIEGETKKYITSEDLKTHNKPGDLWISIQGKVYDVSEWVKDHPGGDIPLRNLAGQEVTDAFIAYHPGTAWAHLDRFFTGYHLEDLKVSEISRDYRELASELRRAGLFESKGHGMMCTMVSVAAMMGLVFYGVARSESVLAHFCCAVVLGMAWIQSAYVGHDSGHYQVMPSRGGNRAAQLLAGNCLSGISIAWWKWTHNAHHIACNSLDNDPDLQHIPVFAVSDKLFGSITSEFYGRTLRFDRVSRLLVSHQHWTYYPVMCVARVNLFVQTLILLASPGRRVPDRALNVAGILVFWTWFPFLVWLLPGWGERVMFVMVSFAVTAVQHVQFTLNHFSAEVYVGLPAGNDWFEKQAGGTIDISCPSWMDWFFGGLQFQLEHHLFPRLPRCQLRRIAPLVRDLCKKHGLPYRSLSFWEANASTLRTLRTAALQARDLSTPAVPKNLVWEAFNTHG